MLQILRKIRSRKILPLLAEQSEFHARNWTADEIRTWQLEQFNREWQTIQRDVPFCAQGIASGGMPGTFSCWEEFRQLMPVIDRKATAARENTSLAMPAAPPAAITGSR